MPPMRSLCQWSLYLSALYCWHLFLAQTWGNTKVIASFGSPPAPSRQRKQVASEVPPPPSPLHLKEAPLPPSPPPWGLPPNSATNTTAMCGVIQPHTEYDGAVMVPGTGPGAAVSSSVADCCALCAKTRGCNVWVACTHSWCGNQCWLKWVDDPSKVQTRSKTSETPWTSGTLHKDIPSELPRPPASALDAVRIVTLNTKFGELRIRLKPQWHLPSVRFVQEAALSDSCTVK